MDAKALLIKWGPQHIAKGVERALLEADKIIVGSPIQPSLAGNIALTAIEAMAGFFAPSPWDEILITMGGHHSTTLWDYLEAMMTPAARVGLGRPTMTYIPTTGQFVPTRPGLGETVRYAPEQRVVTAPKFIPGALRPKYQLGS